MSPATDQGRASFFAHEQWTAGVVGLGYVGQSLALAIVDAGLDVVGYDKDERRIADLRHGRSTVDGIGHERLGNATATRLAVTTQAVDLAACHALFICVPSPLGLRREPDLSFIAAAAETVRTVARPGMLVVLESTSYPGTTEELLVRAVTAAGLELDENAWVAYSPERVSPGDEPDTAGIPKIVGGVTPASTAVAAAAYERFVASVHRVSSAAVAELAKLVENTYRAVNIALANEMGRVADALGISIWEVIDAASTKPFGFAPFYPGPGVGGHCIPLDPQFLAWRARKAEVPVRFIDLAEQINAAQPAYTASRVAAALEGRGLSIEDAAVLGVGIAYKPNVADHRESAAIEVLRRLEEQGAAVWAMDPVVGSDAIASHGYAAVEASDDLGGFDVAVVLTDHDEIDYAALADSVPLVFDARGTYRRRNVEADNVIPL